jgi:hypothetical protein
VVEGRRDTRMKVIPLHWLILLERVLLDLLERSNHYRICQWDVLDLTETAALAAKKAATAAASIPSVVPLPRPRPVVNTVLSDRPRHRIVHLREGARGPLFGLFAPLLKSMH